MIQKVQNLMLLLERMQVLYTRVLEILEREKQALIAFDFEAILLSLREKDEILSVIKALDKDRLRIQDQFAIIMNRDPEEVSLAFLINALKEQIPLEAKRLSQLRGDLGLAVDLVARKVESNRVFIEASVNQLKQIAAQLSDSFRGSVTRTTAREQSKVYTGKGRMRDVDASKGALVEKRL
jgi:hypothetical protein